MTTLLIIIGMITIAAAILDHASGMDRKPKPKKKNDFNSMEYAEMDAFIEQIVSEKD